MSIPMRALIAMNVALLAAVALLLSLLMANPASGADDGETANPEVVLAPAASKAVKGCWHKRTGEIRVLISGRCKTTENRITLGEPGPTGPRGPQGPIGQRGPQGPKGDAGTCNYSNRVTIHAPDSSWDWQRFYVDRESFYAVKPYTYMRGVTVCKLL